MKAYVGRKRFEMKLLKREVAQKLIFGAHSISINSSKTSYKVHSKDYYNPAYTPFDTSTLSFGDKKVVCRKLLGSSQKKLAHKLGIDPCTLRRLERSKWRLSERFLEYLNSVFKPNASG